MSLHKTIQLNNGITIPQIGLGTWLSKPREIEDAVRCRMRIYAWITERDRVQVVWAVEAGYRHLDCAYIYENQDEVRPPPSDLVASPCPVTN